MFNKKINGVIYYRPTALESLQFAMSASKTRERLQRELVKPVSKSGIQKAYKEFLEVTERYDLSKRSDLNYK